MMRRRRNEINDLKVGGLRVTGVQKVKDRIREYFRLHFKHESYPDIFLDFNGMKRIS